MPLPKRKPLRLSNYDYSSVGAYFVTVCTKDRKNLLAKIVGDDAYIVPEYRLSEYGRICEKYIQSIENAYENVKVDQYVIMPNHLHMIILLGGTMRASSPTEIGIPSIVRSLKTMVTKEIGMPIWQRSYHDHIIRDEHDYKEIWNYIDTNILKWKLDRFYTD